MLAALGLLTLGAALLWIGAEAAVRGASGAARSFGIPAFVLGALLFGIDLEGLGAAVAASARGEASLAAGEIFGTVLFLFGGAFGTALLLSKRPVSAPSPLMVLAPAIPLFAAATAIADRFVGRLEGGLLLGIYAGYVAIVVREGHLVRERGDDLEKEAGENPRPRGRLAAMALGGLALLVLGGGVAVAGGTRFVAETGLSDGFVGAAVLGILVSLDEVLLEILPLRRGSPDLATGNLFGTLAAFCSGVLGIAALVRPLDIDSAAALALIGGAVLYTIVASTFLARARAGRWVGLLLLVSYAAWLLVAANV
ncbi:MAG: sodium:calcium antiporter [Actinomycetota bacterium]